MKKRIVKKKTNPVFLISVIMLALFILCTFAYFVIFRKTDSSNSQNAAQHHQNEYSLPEDDNNSVDVSAVENNDAGTENNGMAPASRTENKNTSPSDNNAGDRLVKVINGVEFAFRWCPAGTFTMGSHELETGRSYRENQFQVTLTKGFWIMETEISQKQWEAVMGNNPSHFKDENNPVENVSWNDCQNFCKKCSQYGLNLQLPTEAQWEYACRAGENEAYSVKEHNVWFINNSSQKTHPVGKDNHDNAWGIYDMHGNVLEWCEDWYGAYPNKSVTNPVGPSSGSTRINRGGCWDDSLMHVRSASRFDADPNDRFDTLGFRCVIAQDNTKKTYSNANQSVNTEKHEKNIKPGTALTKDINGVEFTFRWCPPGSFIMGSPLTEKDRKDDEKQHKVILTKGFWIMETEVTQNQWKAIMGYNPSYEKFDTNPVENISWYDCEDFIKKCSSFGVNLKLPTEAQWEYACRAGSNTVFSWGDSLYGDKAACDGSRPYGTSLRGKSRGVIPVKSFEPNAWGLYDMHGNVDERCSDWKADYPSGCVSDPLGPSYGNSRVTRGGNWGLGAGDCRAAIRDQQTQSGSPYIGFRCIIEE